MAPPCKQARLISHCCTEGWCASLWLTTIHSYIYFCFLLHRLRRILRTPVCHVSSIRIPSLQSLTSLKRSLQAATPPAASEIRGTDLAQARNVRGRIVKKHEIRIIPVQSVFPSKRRERRRRCNQFQPVGWCYRSQWYETGSPGQSVHGS